MRTPRGESVAAGSIAIEIEIKNRNRDARKKVETPPTSRSRNPRALRAGAAASSSHAMPCARRFRCRSVRVEGAGPAASPLRRSRRDAP